MPKSKVLICLFILLALVQVYSQDISDKSARELYAMGQDDFLNNKLFQAVEYYRASIRKNPGYFQPYLGLAEVFFLLDEYDEANRYLRDAKRLNKNSTEVKILEARIKIGLGMLEDAEDIFRNVLLREPNNIEAQFGLGELLTAEGKPELAGRQYRDALRISPENRKALLSLAILYDSLGETQNAEQYIKKALRYHANSAMVHVIAGRHFLQSGELEEAQSHAHTALSIDSENKEAMLLLSRIHFDKDQFESAVALSEQLLSQERNNIQAWYIKGLSHASLNQVDQVISSFRNLLSIDPSDEISRIVFEKSLADLTEIEDDRREPLGEYHFNQAEAYMDSNYFKRARIEYRRGLAIDPYSIEGRRGYAEIFRMRGFRSKYLDELTVIKDLGGDTREINDLIEIYQSLLEDSVSAQWDVDQFTIDKDRIDLALYLIPEEQKLEHPEAGIYLLETMRDLLLGHESIDFADEPDSISSYADAFRNARGIGSDYFLILHFNEKDRIFSSQANLYLTRTGSRLSSFSTVRSGNNRVYEALSWLTDRISGKFPLRGRIVQRQGDSALIDLGALDGLELGENLLIIKSGEIRLKSQEAGIEYDEEDLLGRFEVSDRDDLVSEGQIVTEGIIDLVNAGDTVIRELEEEEEDTDDRGALSPLYRRIIEIR